MLRMFSRFLRRRPRTGSTFQVRMSLRRRKPTGGGRFFVQDSTAGVFVDNSSGTPQPVPGDVVAVPGTSHPGGYAPVLSHPRWKKLGTAPLPEAKVVATDQLATGAEDGQRIEISGVVRAVRTSGSKLEVEMVSDGYRLRVYPRSEEHTSELQSPCNLVCRLL